MLIVYTGNGKGKTTAALGAAVRLAGRGRKVFFMKFIKTQPSGEDFVEIKSGNNGEVRMEKCGLGFVGMPGDVLPREKHIEAVKKGLEKIAAEKNNWDAFVFDEINTAVSLELVPEKQILDLAGEISAKNKIVILTGRGAPDSFIRAADLVTEMKEIKHPFQQGKTAEEGLDY